MSTLSSIQLSSNRLTVELMIPGTEYQGSRYDWSSMIKQVTLDNNHSFLSGERYADGSVGMGGVGLASVFEFDHTNLYDEVNIADQFPILGVGLATKTDSMPFQFNKAYPVTTPFPRMISHDENTCTIHTQPILCNGIALEQTKAILVQDNRLIIRNTLRNVGCRPIHAKEFSHNFFCFDRHSVDSTYKLTLPFQISARSRRGDYIIGYNSIQPYCFDHGTQSSALFVEGYAGLGSHTMRLDNQCTGTSVTIIDQFPPSHFYLWCNPGAFCPEVFCKINLEPNETLEYSRIYHFNCL